MVLANYEELEAEGYGELGTQALIKFYEKNIDIWKMRKNRNRQKNRNRPVWILLNDQKAISLKYY
mgnify:CR=1 FL=1